MRQLKVLHCRPTQRSCGAGEDGRVEHFKLCTLNSKASNESELPSVQFVIVVSAAQSPARWLPLFVVSGLLGILQRISASFRLIRHAWRLLALLPLCRIRVSSRKPLRGRLSNTVVCEINMAQLSLGYFIGWHLQHPGFGYRSCHNIERITN